MNVVCTRFPSRLPALRVASRMADGLGARVAVHLPLEIPYPLPLTAPPVPVMFAEKTLLELLSCQPLDTSIQVYLCRDSIETIRQALKAESVVVIAGRKCWWRTREEKLAAILQRDGHHVILTYAD